MNKTTTPRNAYANEVSPPDRTMKIVRDANDAARFLEILAGTIAKDLKDHPRALIEHLETMTGVEGAFLCFKLMELLGKLDDNAGMTVVLQTVTDAVDHD
jgi:hypothetical protein